MLTALGVGYVVLLVVVLVYIKRRYGFFVSGRTALLGWMWVICGPPHVWYWLSGRLGETTFVRITVSFYLMWIAFILTMELVRLVNPRQFRRADTVMRLWSRMSIGPSYISRSRLVLLCSVGLLFMLFVSIYERQVGLLIEFVQLRGQTGDVAVFRGTLGGSKLYSYNLFLAAIAPFFSLLLLLRPAPRHRVYTWVRRAFFVATMLGKVTLFNRSSLGLYIVELIVARPLMRDNRINIRRVGTGVLMVLLIVLPAFYHYEPDLNRIVTYFFDRISTSLYYGMIPYFQQYPDLAPHAMGRNIRVLNWIFYGGEEYIGPMTLFARDAGNYYGVFNAGFVAEAWADFAWPGVVGASVALALSATLGDLVVFSDGVKTPEGTAVLICMVYGVLLSSQTAAQTAMLSGGLGSIPLLAAFLKMLERRKQRASGEAPAGALTESPAVP